MDIKKSILYFYDDAASERPNFSRANLALEILGNNLEKDTSENNHTVTNTNVTLTAGVRANPNSALRLDGTAKLTIPDAVGLRPGTGDFWVSFWVRTTTNAISVNRGIFSKEANPAGTSRFLIVQTAGTDAISVVLADGITTKWSSSTTAINDGIWHHVLFGRIGDDTIIVFDNNTEIFTAGSLGIDVDNSEDIRIGTYDIEVATRFFIGDLALLRYEIATITDQQIAGLYAEGIQNGYPIPRTNMQAEYLLRNALYDSGYFGKHGTLLGGVSYVEDKFGEAKAAVLFDGTTGNINFGDTFDLGTSDFMVSFNINTDTIDANERGILSKTPDGSTAGVVWWAITSYSGKIKLTLDDNTTEYTLETAAVLTVGEWNQIVVARDGADAVIYVRANEVARSTITATNSLDNADDLRAGVVGDDSVTTNFYDGMLTNLRLYSRASTGRDRKALLKEISKQE